MKLLKGTARASQNPTHRSRFGLRFENVATNLLALRSSKPHLRKFTALVSALETRLEPFLHPSFQHSMPYIRFPSWSRKLLIPRHNFQLPGQSLTFTRCWIVADCFRGLALMQRILGRIAGPLFSVENDSPK